jgi:uncharacterized protein DUF6946
MATIRYRSKLVADFQSLVDEPFNLKSPSRSTVPFLAYWANFDTRLAQFGHALPLDIPANGSLTFEYTVSPTRGKGAASQTDLMILAPSLVIATEAKFTESKYKSVAEWLGTSPSENRKQVLQGWLDTINRAAKKKIAREQVRNVTYQLIHRDWTSPRMVDTQLRV